MLHFLIAVLENSVVAKIATGAGLLLVFTGGRDWSHIGGWLLAGVALYCLLIYVFIDEHNEWIKKQRDASTQHFFERNTNFDSKETITSLQSNTTNIGPTSQRSTAQNANPIRQTIHVSAIKKAGNLESPRKELNKFGDDPEIISASNWHFDSVKKILWNSNTKECLQSNSGVGFSLSKDYFILYNKTKPRRLFRSSVSNKPCTLDF